MWLIRLHKPISHARELLLCYTSKKVISKLHKLLITRATTQAQYIYESKYKLVYGDRKPMGRWWHNDFYPEVHLVATKLVPIVSTTHLVVWRLISITHQAHMLGTARTYPQVRIAQWHALLVLLFMAPTGWARYPSQILLWSHAKASHGLHNGERNLQDV
jgi:hypothetical protein